MLADGSLDPPTAQVFGHASCRHLQEHGLLLPSQRVLHGDFSHATFLNLPIRYYRGFIVGALFFGCGILGTLYIYDHVTYRDNFTFSFRLGALYFFS